MRVWIVKTGEPLPLDDNVRPVRAAALSAVLAGRGHDVTYWASTFDHQQKRHIDRAQVPGRLASGARLRLLDGPPYRRNISFARLRNHRQEAQDFLAQSASEPRPDVILCCLPTLDLAVATADLGRRWDVPVIIDVRDMWPEIFVHVVPPALRPMARIALGPLYNQLRRATGSARAITGVSQGLVDYAVSHSGRDSERFDRVFPSALVDARLTQAETARADAFWDSRGLTLDGPRNIACYVGTLTRRASAELVDIARLFRHNRNLATQWRLVICGTGDLEPALREAGGEAVEFTGWIGRAEISRLLARASVGIIPYPNAPDFLTTCPNKFGEYLSAGLPIVSHLDGECGLQIRQADCGWVYRSEAEFLAALAEARTDRAAHDARRARSKALYQSTFDAETVYRAFADHIETVAAAG